MATSNLQILPPYNMTHASRGPVLIFNNQNYTAATGLEKRKFNDIDAANLMKSLKNLGYKDIAMKKDLTAEKMLKEIKIVARADHSTHDSVVVIFLAYGEHNLVYATDRAIGIQVLLDPLKGDVCNPTLVGKPKIIISQTCNPSIRTYANDSTDKEAPVIRVIPTEADFLYLGSEVPGLITGRKMTDGSIFIANLCKRLLTDGKNLEIRKLMTRTLADVEAEMDNWNSEWAESYDDRMPFMASMLTRDLLFTSNDM